MPQPVRKLADRPLYERILLATGAVLAVVTAAGILVSRLVPELPLAVLLPGFLVLGLGLAALVDYVLVKVVVHPLLEVSRIIAAIHRGEALPRAAGASPSDPDLRAVSSALLAMSDRLEHEARRYSSRLLTSIEDERRRIGRELHDETSQTLAAILISLDLAEKGLLDVAPEVRTRVANSKELIRHSLDQIKLLVYDLRPSMLDDLGLLPALRWYIQSHLEGSGVEVVTDFEGAEGRLPEHTETAFYRIAQETLSNVVKHAHATKVSVLLEIQPGYARLAIHDDGVGFDTGEVMSSRADQPGFGLLSIKERVELLNGTLNVVSGQMGGTHLYVVIPLEGGTDE
jgi:two-component system, NarL family, sensor histidine kinase UhpB